MPKYLLYKPLKNLAKILSFGQNIEISLGGCFFAHPVNLGRLGRRLSIGYLGSIIGGK